MRSVSLVFSLLFAISLTGQHGHSHTYVWDWKQDGYILGGSALFWASSIYVKSQTEKITLADLDKLNADDLPGFDRAATDNWRPNADKISDVFLFSSIALPFLPHISKECRAEEFKIVGMAFETFFLTDGITNMTKALRSRYRPFTYNAELSDDIRLSNGAKFSFPSGHTSSSAALAFFAAKVYSDIHPDSQWKPLIWSLAVTFPAINGYLRYRAGKHFPSDVITGYLIGAGIGVLVPSLHRLEHEDMHMDVRAMPNGLNLNITF